MDVALPSDETKLQLNTLAGFHVVTYMAEDDNNGLPTNVFFPEQMNIMLEVMLAVVTNGATSEDGVDRTSIVEGGLQTCLPLLRVHCHRRRDKAYLPENEALLSSLIVKDMKQYSQQILAGAASAGKTGPTAIGHIHNQPRGRLMAARHEHPRRWRRVRCQSKRVPGRLRHGSAAGVRAMPCGTTTFAISGQTISLTSPSPRSTVSGNGNEGCGGTSA